MKNKGIAHSHEAARIYKQYYKPSLNPIRLVRSFLLVFLTGSAPGTESAIHRRMR